MSSSIRRFLRACYAPTVKHPNDGGDNAAASSLSPPPPPPSSSPQTTQLQKSAAHEQTSPQTVTPAHTATTTLRPAVVESVGGRSQQRLSPSSRPPAPSSGGTATAAAHQSSSALVVAPRQKMALLAQHSNSSALVPTSGPDTGGGGGGGGGLSIQDVTDDPEYADYGNEKDASPEQDWWPDEKALVDYAHGREVAHPRVFGPQETSRVVSNGGKKPSLLPQPGPPPPSVVATTKRGVADGKSKKPLAPHHQEEEVVEEMPRRDNLRLIDVEVGRPCSKLVECGCRGFKPHQWRKICVHCRHERSDHELAPHQSLNVYERLGIKPPQGSMPGATAAAASSAANNANSKPTGSEPGSAGHGYTWVPPGLNRKKVEEYMAALPNHVVPRVNSPGEKYRERQLIVQLPRQDLSAAYARHLSTPAEKKVYEDFVNARNEIALDIGYVQPTAPKDLECQKCHGLIERGEMSVVAPKLGDAAGWHPACFTCATCDQLLVDLTYCLRDQAVYCERHYAELHKPRCSACDELIFSGEYTKAMNRDWHSEHFCCTHCDKSLTGQRYIMRDEQPYCIGCYEEVFANSCDECQKPIGIDSKDLSYKDKHWHEGCFLCTMCKLSLVDQPFGSKNDAIYCANCYDQAFATRCDGCGQIFRAGMKKMEYKGKQWHDSCFSCALCKVPIGTKSFIPKNDDVFCATCYEDKFAVRCTKCSKVIATGGVTYKNEPWHRECFCCVNCNQSLAGQRFTSKDDKPYCANCYGDLFAKRCYACSKPITGIGGAKFISFEDRTWHNDCFTCAVCSGSLVGKGFITDGADVLCPDCARARLMATSNG